jgi:hypothetical protein
MDTMLRDPVEERSAWSAETLAADPSWIHALDAAELAELEAATAGVRARGLEAGAFGREEFPLPRLAARLRAIVDEVENGRGCMLLRGIDVDAYDVGSLRLLYWGLGVHLGEPISQNAAGERMAEVRDTGGDYEQVNVRGYRTRAALDFHCDASDMVTLLCVHPARSGGESLVASATAIHNELLATRPEVLPPLYAGFHFDLRGEGATGDPDEVTRHPVPVYSFHAGRLSCRYNRKTIEDGQRKAGDPLDGERLAAVRSVGELAARPGVHHAMDLRRGDLQVLSNHTVLHARRAFEDHPEPHRRRNLWRLWLNVRGGRPLLPAFAERLNTGPRRGVAILGVDYPARQPGGLAPL